MNKEIQGNVKHKKFASRLQISMKFLLQVASDIRRILQKFQSSKSFSLEIRKKRNPDFTLIYLFDKKSVQTLLEENCKLVN